MQTKIRQAECTGKLSNFDFLIMYNMYMVPFFGGEGVVFLCCIKIDMFIYSSNHSFPSVGRLVGLSGIVSCREVTLPYSYRITCLICLIF